MSTDPKSFLPVLVETTEALQKAQQHVYQLAGASVVLVQQFGGEFILPTPILYGKAGTGLERFESYIALKDVDGTLVLTNFYGEQFGVSDVCMTFLYHALRQLVTTAVASAEMVGKQVSVYDPGTGFTHTGKLLSLNPTKVQIGKDVLECARGSIVVALTTEGAS